MTLPPHVMQDAAFAGMSAKVDGVTDWALAVENILNSLKLNGYVLCNKTLTMDQRNAAHDAMTSNRYNIQPMFDAILEKRPK